MRYITDFHIHSKYARACSKRLELETIAAWSQIKGIQVVSTGDFTHPAWFTSIQEKVEESMHKGLYQLKEKYQNISEEYKKSLGSTREFQKLFFILGTEVSCIYSKGGAVRRIHALVFAPSIEIAKKINEALSKIGNLASDGRPILGLDVKKLCKIVFDISPDCMVIPAHVWTPWFALFGSKSGFNALEECFEELTPHIFACETGLSSDPFMNWKLSQLNTITLVSNSDAHSPEHLGREANVFEGDDISYALIMDVLKAGKKGVEKLKLDYTIEFYPEEGMYHVDGHRTCNYSCTPKETQRLKGVCPVCKRNLTVGVLNRIGELQDQDPKKVAPTQIGYKNIIPLSEIIAQYFDVKNKNSKKVQKIYFELINRFGNEFEILLDVPPETISQNSISEIGRGIHFMRKGEIEITPGFDGVYGTIRVPLQKNKKQESLLSFL